ncbi:MAG: ROK family protein [Bryobacterales bacterium]|nr:ROK family protein [Bryobacteraceae bacterium]MDW8354155.1 ROK family protein [Bryobacterales bacterium]
MTVLGVDIGGTKIAAGVVADNAEVLRTVTVPTRASEGYEVSIGQVYKAVEECLDGDVAAIGICSPGPLNPKTGVVLHTPNLPWRNVPLAELVGQRFHLPCKVDNDANAAGLAEALFGAARGYSSVFYVTLSTGIGTGIVLDRKIYHGKNGFAAEGGHVTVDYRSPLVCNCGNIGCIEAYSSGTAIEKRFGVRAEELARGVEAGDPTALQRLDEICLALGAWLGSMISLLDPDVIVIGGGVARIGDPLFERLRRITPTRTINPFAADTPIVPAALGDNVGILGAAALVLA